MRKGDGKLTLEKEEEERGKGYDRQAMIGNDLLEG